ncbi:MAG TPA: tetratricopeptide repeat protein [Steroidobacteraceae bacterium]
MLKTFRTHLVLVLALGVAGPVLAQADPTLHQIYEATQAGHLTQAQQMVDQVLRDHPQSAKAHYVAAELYAREGNLPSARRELSTAQTLEPGLPFARPGSVQALQRELSQGQGLRGPGFAASAAPAYARPHSGFPWGWVLLLVGAVAVLAAMFRRRASPVYTQYPAGAAPVGSPGYGPGYMGPGYGGPGVGSGIAGGLASGLAVGAGVVAGEELAHHFLDGGRRDGNLYPANEPGQPENTDLGGSDFGVSDGGSWDDGGSVGGDISGGDDWT